MKTCMNMHISLKIISKNNIGLNVFLFKNTQCVNVMSIDTHCYVRRYEYFAQKETKPGSPGGGSRIYGMGVQNASRGGLFSTFYPIYHKFPNEIEISWSQSGVGVERNP